MARSGLAAAGLVKQRDGSLAVRLLADDLTGALDTAAQFACPSDPLPVTWSAAIAQHKPGPIILDTGNRERSAGAAAATFATFVGILEADNDCLSFLKLDSLLRGHAGQEIAACAHRWPARPIIVAPAMPYQGRVTRGGRQFLVQATNAEPVGEDFCISLRAADLEIRHRQPGDTVPAGVSLWDAENDADLSKIVAAGRASGVAPVWCGSAGLAGALAGALRPSPAGHPPAAPVRPILGVFGSDHPLMVRQIANAGPQALRIADGSSETARRITSQLRSQGIALLSFDMPALPDRREACRRIDATVRQLLPQLCRPATLVVSGGETVKSICNALGAISLDVDGQLEPGIPTSRMRDGSWHGLGVISKSGAFGRPEFLEALLASAQPGTESGAS